MKSLHQEQSFPQPSSRIISISYQQKCIMRPSTAMQEAGIMVILHLQPSRARKMGEKKASRKASRVQMLSLTSRASLDRSLTLGTGGFFDRASVLALEDVT